MNKDHENLRAQHKKNYFKKAAWLKQGPIKTIYFYSVVYFLDIWNLLCYTYYLFTLNYMVYIIFL